MRETSRGWLLVGWEAGWKGGVEDGEIGVEKSVGESVAARIGQRWAPSPVVSVQVSEDKSFGVWVSEESVEIRNVWWTG